MKKPLSLTLAMMLCLGLVLPAAAKDTQAVKSYTTISEEAYITNDGSLWMWGSNSRGQLGNGTRSRSHIPIKVMDDVVSVSCSEYHTAAIQSDSSLWVWGSNMQGALGNGGEGNAHDTYGMPCQTTPIKIMDDVAAVSCDSYYTAALKTDGSLWTWGSSIQIGNGGVGNASHYGDMYQSVPVKIMDDVVYVSGSAAIKSDGSLWMWGSNSFGQLMDKNVGDQLDSHGDRYQSVPVKVMDDVIFVDAVDTTIAAIKSDGSLWMWGSDYAGKLGCGSEYAPENLPVKVLNDVAAVSVGHNVAAVKRDGSLWMWGANQNGQINKLKNVTTVYTPTKVLDGVSAVYCSSVEPMAIKADGSLWVWGYGVDLADGKFAENVALPSYANITVSPTVAGFSDVHESNYYAEAVAWAKDSGITGGTTATTFSPSATVTRAQAVTFLWRAAGSPQPSTTVSPFSDVTDPSAYYYNAVLWAAEQGITTGVTATTFGTGSAVAYDQMLAFLARAAGADTGSGSWSDAAISWAADNGLTDGLTFTAKAACPRSDVVYCLWKQLS